MDIQSQKAAARKIAFQNRKAAFQALRPDIVDAVSGVVQDHEIISAYMPIRTEINPLPAMSALTALGKRVCVPVIEGEGLPLSFHEWTPEAKLVEGPFGARIPENGDELEPSLVLAPLVAFDDDGVRLGYGGGFYDRTIEKLRAVQSVRYIGLAFDAQRAAAPLPREATDILLDGIITETGYHSF